MGIISKNFKNKLYSSIYGMVLTYGTVPQLEACSSRNYSDAVLLQQNLKLFIM